MTILCNQGCKTHIYFKNGVPYNVSDNEPHEKTCQSLKIGKYWGGYYNTIPIDRIKGELEEAFKITKQAYTSRKVDDVLASIKRTTFALEFVMRQIKDQEQWNAKQKAEFAEYKTRLVQEQTLRDERKKSKAKELGHDWTVFDNIGMKHDLYPTDDELSNE